VKERAAGTVESSQAGDGWKAGRCRHVQIAELFSLERSDQAVMDFLAALEVGKFPRH